MTIALICIAAIAFAGMCAVYKMAFYSPMRGRTENFREIPPGEQYQQERPRMKKLIDDFAALPHERWEITSHDGLRLSARFYPAKDGAPVQIMMHGYRGSAIRDFCGGGRIAMDAGCSVLLVDERGNGKSEGRTITFGVKERLDCLSWIEEVLKRCGRDTEIVLSGVSMGAATVIMTTELNLPENVKGVVADCPYSEPAKIIRKVCGDLHIPAGPAMPLAYAAARILGGFDLSGASAIKAAKASRIPILIIHGEDDRFVPCDMSREIKAANPEKVRLETFPDAGHGLSYIVDTPRYEAEVNRFLEKILKKSEEVQL